MLRFKWIAIVWVAAAFSVQEGACSVRTVKLPAKHKPSIDGDWKLLYKPDPSIGVYINDHTLYRHESTGKWHLIGITSTNNPADANTERFFAHGVGDELIVEGGYIDTKQKLFDSPELAWAPYAFNHKGKALIFYGPQRIVTSTSTDGIEWAAPQLLKRIPPVWKTDGSVNPAHRDGMIIRVEENGKEKWLMYATALMTTHKDQKNYSAVELFESSDLKNWESRGFALTTSGDAPYNLPYSSCESPFVMKYGDYYYLSITYVDYGRTVDWGKTYSNTIIFRSTEPNNPYSFGDYNGDESMIVARLKAHAPEYVVDPETGKWYITTCGWVDNDIPFPGGVGIAELGWKEVQKGK